MATSARRVSQSPAPWCPDGPVNLYGSSLWLIVLVSVCHFHLAVIAKVRGVTKVEGLDAAKKSFEIFPPATFQTARPEAFTPGHS